MQFQPVKFLAGILILATVSVRTNAQTIQSWYYPHTESHVQLSSGNAQARCQAQREFAYNNLGSPQVHVIDLRNRGAFQPEDCAFSFVGKKKAKGASIVLIKGAGPDKTRLQYPNGLGACFGAAITVRPDLRINEQGPAIIVEDVSVEGPYNGWLNWNEKIPHNRPNNVGNNVRDNPRRYAAKGLWAAGEGSLLCAYNTRVSGFYYGITSEFKAWAHIENTVVENGGDSGILVYGGGKLSGYNVAANHSADGYSGLGFAAAVESINWHYVVPFTTAVKDTLPKLAVPNQVTCHNKVLEQIVPALKIVPVLEKGAPMPKFWTYKQLYNLRRAYLKAGDPLISKPRCQNSNETCIEADSTRLQEKLLSTIRATDTWRNCIAEISLAILLQDRSFMYIKNFYANGNTKGGLLVNQGADTTIEGYCYIWGSRARSPLPPHQPLMSFDLKLNPIEPNVWSSSQFGTGIGVIARQGSRVRANGCISVGNLIGFSASRYSSIAARNAKAVNNAYYGYHSVTYGLIDAPDAQAFGVQQSVHFATEEANSAIRVDRVSTPARPNSFNPIVPFRAYFDIIGSNYEIGGNHLLPQSNQVDFLPEPVQRDSPHGIYYKE